MFMGLTCVLLCEPTDVFVNFLYAKLMQLIKPKLVGSSSILHAQERYESVINILVSLFAQEQISIFLTMSNYKQKKVSLVDFFQLHLEYLLSFLKWALLCELQNKIFINEPSRVISPYKETLIVKPRKKRKFLSLFLSLKQP